MELCRYYFAYGLLLKSNRALPGLTETKKTGKADIIFFVKKEPRYRHHVSGRKEDVQDNPQRFVFLPTADNFLLRLPDGIKFLISADASYIEATIPSTSTMEDMVMTLQGIVLGLVFRIRGRTCLHASVIVVHERAVAIMGPRGIGKSTLAAAFARQNFAVVSDDILVIDQCDEGVMAYPGYSGIRLCPDSVDKVIGKVDGLEPVTSRRNKLFLDLSRAPYSFAARPCLLSGIYFLSPNEQMQTPVCRTTTKAESLFALLANIYPSPLLYGLNKDIESSSFMALGRLVNSITVKELCYKRDLASLEQLCQHLLQDAEQMVR